MFRPTVAISRFYSNLYAKKKVFMQCAPSRIDVEFSSSTCRTKFISYDLSVHVVFLSVIKILVVFFTVVTPT